MRDAYGLIRKFIFNIIVDDVMSLRHVLHHTSREEWIDLEGWKKTGQPPVARIYIGFIEGIPIRHVAAEFINHFLREINPQMYVLFFFPTAARSKPFRIGEVMQHHHDAHMPCPQVVEKGFVFGYCRGIERFVWLAL